MTTYGHRPRAAGWVVLWTALLGAVAGFGAVACGGGSGDSPDCLVSLECPSGQVCREGRCVDDSDLIGQPDAADDPDRRDGATSAPPDGAAPDSPGSNEMDAGPPLPDAGPSCNEPSCNQCADRYPDAIACETFDENLDDWFAFASAGSAAELTTDPYHLGGGSLRTAVPMDASGGVREGSVRQELDPAIDSGEFYVRFELYVPAGEPPSKSVPLVFVRRRVGGEKVSIDLGRRDAVQAVMGNGTFVGSAPGVVRRGGWTCLEAHVRLHDTDTEGLLELWVNGIRVDANTGDQIAAPVGGYDDLKVGAATIVDTPEAFEAYIDELVVSRTGPIGCED